MIIFSRPNPICRDTTIRPLLSTSTMNYEPIGALDVPFSKEGDIRRRVHLMPNPCMFRVNEGRQQLSSTRNRKPNLTLIRIFRMNLYINSSLVLCVVI